MQPLTLVFALVFVTWVQAGTLFVKNECPFPIHVWSVDNVQYGPWMIAPGTYWQEDYRTNDNGGGVSVKLTQEAIILEEPITQFEYTFEPWNDRFWYDLSRVDGAAFLEEGISTWPMGKWVDNCMPLNCLPNEVCGDAYNEPLPSRTHVCNATNDMVVNMCRNN